MLLSLISVLVLLVVGFYAVWMGVTGRISNADTQELSVSGRALVLGVAFLAFAGSYLIYRNPGFGGSGTESAQSASAETLSAPPAMSSNPPDSRGSEPTESANEAASSKAAAAEVADAGSADEPAVADKAAESSAAAATPTATAAVSTVDDREATDSGGLSAGALLLEAKAQRRSSSEIVQSRSAPVEKVMPEEQTSEQVMSKGAATADARRAVPAMRAASGTTKAAASRRRSTSAPLLLHVHNTLGRNQQREQLTLSIEGLAVADIEVDDSRRSVAVAVPLPRPGLLHYRLEGVSEQDGSTTLVGEGCIRVRDGASFAVRRREGSRKVFLETAG